MKQKTRFLFMLMAMVIGQLNAWGETAGFTLSGMPSGSSGKTSGIIVGDASEEWSWSLVGSSFNGTNAGAWQLGSRNDPATSASFSTAGISGTITKVVVKCSSYAAATVNVTVGGNAFGSIQTSSTGQDLSDLTFEGNASGTIVVTMTNATSGRYMLMKSITVTYTASGISTPTFSPTAGEVAKNTVVTFGCDTDGVTFYYTTDGKDPTTSSATGTSYTVNSDVTLMVIAVKDGESSSVATASYTVAKNNPNLAFSQTSVKANIGEAFTPPTLTYADGYDGTITYSSSNSAITVNPTTGEVTFDASAVGKTTTITATATETTNFLGGTASYVLTVQDPNAISGNLNNSTFGTNYEGQLPEGFTSLTGHVGDVTVIYSRGSNTQTRAYITNNEMRMYNGYELTFEAPEGYFIKSLVFNNDITSFSCDNGSISGTQWSTTDDLTSVTFTGSKRVDLKTVVITLEANASSILKPTITPGSGTYTTAQTVTITNNAEGATVYYTIDGTKPTASSTVYTAPFVLKKNGTYTIKAIAITDEGSSVVATSTITIDHTVAAPVFTETSGTTFTEPYTIHITAETGSTIYYTMGSESPVDDSGNLTSGAIAYNPTTGIANLSKAVTITAVSVDEGGNVSHTATATYKYSGTVPVPYYENFDEGLGNFTTESTGTTPPQWVFRTSATPADIEKYGEARRYAYVTGNNNKRGTARLISPVIDLTDETIQTASLNFIHAGRYFDGYDADDQSESQTADGNAPTHAQLFVREEGGNWVQVTIPNWFTQNSQYTRFNSGEISLNDYVGKKIQVSFLYTADNTSTGTWNVLKFAVTATNAEETEHYETVTMKTSGYVSYVVQNDIDWVKTLDNNNAAEGIDIHGYKVVKFTPTTVEFVEFGHPVSNADHDAYYSEPMIPAETPIILKGTAGGNNLVIAKSDDVITKPVGNLLKASYGDVAASADQHFLVLQKEKNWTEEDPYNNYAFFKVKAGRTIPNRKAYLNGGDVSEDDPSAPNASPAIGVYMHDDATDGIAEVGTATPAFDLNGTVYDLSGRRVDGPLRKGIYIISGRKVIIK